MWLLAIVAVVLIAVFASACGGDAEGAGASSVEPRPAVDLNPAADVVEVKLIAQPARVRYFSGGATDVWGYRDGAARVVTVPGPIIRAKQGDRVIVRFENRLPESTTIHWHGIRVPNMSDGTPTTQMEVAPGAEFTYEFNADDAGTFWYHPHVRGDVQVEHGLYGMLVVAGGAEVPVHADRAFVLDDVKLEASGPLSTKTEALDLMLGRQGNVLLVNGRSDAAVTAQAGARERWRFVNSANGRYFNLRLPGRRFKVIAWDGGLVPAPYETDTLLVAPGERYEVIVTLDGAAGETLSLETIHYDRGHNVPDPGPKTILKVRLGNAAPAIGPLPNAWGEMPALMTTAATATRSLVLSEQEATGPGAEPRFLINDMTFPPPLAGKSDDVEIWSVKNDSEMDHPFHLHGMFFQVLDVDGVAPAHSGWKDTVNIPQKKTLRFAVKYGQPGRWMYHCHILEHAERGMMGELHLTNP